MILRPWLQQARDVYDRPTRTLTDGTAALVYMIRRGDAVSRGKHIAGEEPTRPTPGGADMPMDTGDGSGSASALGSGGRAPGMGRRGRPMLYIAAGGRVTLYDCAASDGRPARRQALDVPSPGAMAAHPSGRHLYVVSGRCRVMRATHFHRVYHGDEVLSTAAPSPAAQY